MSARAVVLVADNRQLMGRWRLAGVALILFGAGFGGGPLVTGMVKGQPNAPAGFILLGIAAFFCGIFFLLRRRQIRLDPAGRQLEDMRRFLGFESVTRSPLAHFDRVSLEPRRGSKGSVSYELLLRGAGERQMALGAQSEHAEAVQAGLRAAAATGLPLDEATLDGAVVRLRPEQVAPLAEELRVLEEEEAAAPPWWRRPSVLALVAANLVPLAGVLWLDWEILPLMALFWLENLIVGAYTVARMALAQGDGFAKIGLIPFFMVHYGGFCAVHGVFVFALFGRGSQAFSHLSVWLAIAALVVSHGVSFVVNYVRPGAYQVSEARALMLTPYKRVVALHVVLLAGGFLVAGRNSPVLALALLTLVKIAIDVAAHVSEHRAPIVREYRQLAESAGVAMLPAQAQPAAPVARQDINDKPLAHYIGTWRLAPGDSASPGWFKEIVLGLSGSKLAVRLTSQPGGPAIDKLVSAQVRGDAAAVEWIEVRLAGAGRERVLRFTAPGTGGDRIELHEVQHPAGKPKAMQARSFSLARA